MKITLGDYELVSTQARNSTGSPVGPDKLTVNDTPGVVMGQKVIPVDRAGLYVPGGTAAYPRVQIHSLIENEPLDKDNSVRRLELIVESISDKAYGEAVEMNEESMSLLFRDDPRLDNDHLRIVGITPGQLTEINETSDSAGELFRQLQRVTVFVEAI